MRPEEYAKDILELIEACIQRLSPKVRKQKSKPWFDVKKSLENAELRVDGSTDHHEWSLFKDIPEFGEHWVFTYGCETRLLEDWLDPEQALTIHEAYYEYEETAQERMKAVDALIKGAMKILGIKLPRATPRKKVTKKKKKAKKAKRRT